MKIISDQHLLVAKRLVAIDDGFELGMIGVDADVVVVAVITTVVIVVVGGIVVAGLALAFCGGRRELGRVGLRLRLRLG